MIKYLSQWIKHNVAIMSDRSFPNNPVELKVLLLVPVFLGFILFIMFTVHATVLQRSDSVFPSICCVCFAGTLFAVSAV